MRILLFFAFLLTPGLGAQQTPGESLPVREHTLENGLRLLILPRPGAPTISFVVTYRIGSVNERPGETGIAHVLEHLLFKGTTTVGTTDYAAEVPLLAEMDMIHDSILMERDESDPDTLRINSLREKIRALGQEASAFVVSNEFNAILSENGSRGLNATTTNETTTYFVELPSNRAELWFVLEADRMRNPVFREFYSELDVVEEERRLRLENNPAGILYAAHLAEAFEVHPYGIPVIGTARDLQRLSREEVRQYFRRFYGPNNAVVTITGHLDPDQIFQWAKEYLGSIPRGTDPPGVESTEPEQTAERRVEVRFDAEPNLRIGWKVPSSLHEDSPAMVMLASILTGGRSSRIYKRLVVEERLAASVTSGTGPGNLFPGIFAIDAVPRAPHTAAEVEGAIYEEIERLKNEPPTQAELQRVRNQLEASGVRRLRSNFGLALQISQSASIYGSWRETFSFSRAMEQVTPRDIQRVVRDYFLADRRTVATLLRPDPEGGE